MANLTGPQIGKIAHAIGDAYSLEMFEDFLLTRLNKRFDVIVGNKPLGTGAIKLVQAASMQGWDTELLRALRESRPAMADIFTVAAESGLTNLPLATENLERTVTEGAPHREFPKVLKRLGQLQFRICKISYPVSAGTVTGTGFLIGPSTVITNRHVVARIINKEYLPDTVSLTFDYYRSDIGLSANSGTVCKLASSNDWLIDSSSHHALDTDANADQDAARPDDCLDYALLKTENNIGSLGIGNAEDSAALRGWIYADAAAPIPDEDEVVFVFQHPDGQPLKWAQPDIIVGQNSNKNRIRYRVNTEPGSSGSPVFNAGFELTALHHAGDPNFEIVHKPEYNQGIPIRKIVSLIQKRGFDSSLGDDSEGEM